MSQPITAVGTVLSSDNHHALIEVETAGACEMCAAGRGCGAGALFVGGSQPQTLSVPLAAAQVHLDPGDSVDVSIACGSLERLAWKGYGVLLGLAVMGLVAGSLAGRWMGAAPDLCGFMGMVLAIAAGLIWQRQTIPPVRVVKTGRS